MYDSICLLRKVETSMYNLGFPLIHMSSFLLNMSRFSQSYGERVFKSNWDSRRRKRYSLSFVLCHILKEVSQFVTMTLFSWTAIQRLLKFWVFIDTW